MSENKMFRLCDGVTLSSLGIIVEDFLKTDKKLITQKMDSKDTIIIQGKQNQDWKTLTGLASAIQVQIKMFDEETVNVEIGNGKWADKLGAGAVGALAFAPLALTAAYGAWAQKKMPVEIFARIEQHIFNRGKDMPTAQNAMANTFNPDCAICPNCNVPNEKNAKFCDSCGGKLTKACPQCKASIPSSKMFCSECGYQLGGPKVCSSCNAEIPEGKKFCGECGTKI